MTRLDAAPPTVLLRARQIGHTWPDGRETLRDVSFTLHDGEFVAIVGQSGVGKSTLLRLVGGLLSLSAGQIERGRPDGTIGIVFQSHNLMPWRTVFDNVRLPLEIAGQRGPHVDARIQQLIALVGLTGHERDYPAQLSGGMAQRVAIARALADAPQLLLLDEPFGALDAFTRERMVLELLRIRAQYPVTGLMVTHSIDEAVLLSDRVLVLGGRPGALVLSEPIALPYPRTPALRQSAPFQTHVEHIRAAIDAAIF